VRFFTPEQTEEHMMDWNKVADEFFR